MSDNKTLTVDRIYDTPNLSGASIGDIGWSPDGRILSYVLGREHGNEIWAFDTGTKHRKMLFDFSRLKGASLASAPHERAKHGETPMRDWRSRRVRPNAALSYQWTPDGQMLLVAAAGSPPHLLNLLTDELLPVSRDDEAIRDTKISPNGQFVSFVRGWDLYMVDLASAQEIPLTTGSTEVLRTATPDTMGDLLVDSGHWWSPDSSQIAYLQTDEREVPIFWYADLMSSRGWNVPERYPQAGDAIPVMALKVASARGHQWIDTRAWPGWYLARVTWLPDSRHLALQMLNREQNELCLVIADSHTGTTRTVLVESDPAWVNVVDDLRFFSDSQRFLWSSERDSYRHLFLYDIDGNQLLQLTSGSEPSVAVEGLDEKNAAVYYLVFPDPYTDGRLKRVSFQKGAANYKVTETSVITTRPGTHFAHLSPDYSYFADNFSTAIQPPRLDLCRTDGEIVTTVEENGVTELADYDLADFDFRSIPAAKLGIPSDDMPLWTKLLKPSVVEEGKKYPVVVYVYGGPLPGGFGLARNVLNYWRPVPELWMQMMAQRGFGVFSLDNRGSNAAPRGHDWETPIHKQLGHVELADQLAGVEYLKSLPWVDPDRIGLLGGSFGGFMTLNGMLRAPGTFKSGVAFAPVTNWREYDCVYVERYMELPDQNTEGYDETALPQYSKALTGELLMIHGAADPNVHLQHSIQTINELIQDSKKFRMTLYPKQVHMSFFGMGQSPARLWTRITDFFLETLTENQERPEDSKPIVTISKTN